MSSPTGNPTVKRAVERARMEREAYLIWNAFIDLLALEDYSSLSPLQRKAHLVFWYDSEVQNGGHGQYFENQGFERLGETVVALKELGLAGQAGVLSRAIAARSKLGAETDWTEVFPDGAIEELDSAFHLCQPTITAALEQHLASHREEYVVPK